MYKTAAYTRVNSGVQKVTHLQQQKHLFCTFSMFVFCFLLFVCNPALWLLYINIIMLKVMNGGWYYFSSASHSTGCL